MRNPLPALLLALALIGVRSAGAPRKLHALFIGNSYTARHNLARVVKAMAEAGDPELTFQITQVIYGGRRLVDHWRLGTQNYVRIAELTVEEEKATIEGLRKTLEENPEGKYAKQAIRRHGRLLRDLAKPRPKWDIVVLQSYRDDVQGDKSPYMAYAPKFAALAKAAGARVVLYETTPATQNARPLANPPNPDKVMDKAKRIAALADQIGAVAVPMSLVALRCQRERPDLTLRFVNDAHLNHTMAYLTACTFYATLFDRTPQGLSVDSITDIRFLEKDGKRDKTKDRDGKPITRTFAGKDLADLQRIAWEGLNEFRKLRATK